MFLEAKTKKNAINICKWLVCGWVQNLRHFALKIILGNVQAGFQVMSQLRLEKRHLISTSGLLTKLIGDNPNEDGLACVVHLNDIPGGVKAFELIAKFCYGVKLEITSHNVISLRCAAEYLQMTDDYGAENLITQTEIFLNEVFTTWSDTMNALESCEEVLSDAEELHLISRCINSLAMKACSGPNAYDTRAMSAVNNNNITKNPIFWNGISTSAKPQTFGENWWYKDVSFLGLHLYKRVILAMMSEGMKAETIAGSLVGYVTKYIPLMNRQSSFNDASHSKPVSTPSEADQRVLLEEIVGLLPNRKGIVGTKFLIRLLRTAMVLHVSPSCRENLEKRVGAQLDSAVVDDLLIPNQGFNSVDTLYDIDCFQRILDYFMSMDSCSAVCSPCIVEEGLEDGAQSLTTMTSVANLVDAYLADVAADVNLKFPKFQSLAVAVPDYARPHSDGIYRAVDIYLKAHLWLTDCEREQICRLMNIQKLSLEASTHAAQNERLPLRVIVQILFFEQVRLRTSIAGWFFVSENVEDHANDREMVGSACMGEMRERVVELERECENMKLEIRKLVKKKRSWSFFCKRRRHRRL
ncbi:BTB/POZ domain-containing protein At5g03250-like isoform X2 [Cynara cardunculus var. scolymus]|uniref:BTB/POZ domain-containing protein At5g03250-like isoform X2 n=1 Tax=Cynara cardunculus var. scolymus TaxID=59895 RepID=UPI000D62BAFA|nr:BTB/POZ domain-containing protein At5g03250-like isoform X2 [Cynara cardunculus var. scolymus]